MEEAQVQAEQAASLFRTMARTVKDRVPERVTRLYLKTEAAATLLLPRGPAGRIGAGIMLNAGAATGWMDRLLPHRRIEPEPCSIASSIVLDVDSDSSTASDDDEEPTTEMAVTPAREEFANTSESAQVDERYEEESGCDQNESEKPRPRGEKEKTIKKKHWMLRIFGGKSVIIICKKEDLGSEGDASDDDGGER